jgi:predicted phosphate transport protein (TIGR00153 family)
MSILGPAKRLNIPVAVLNGFLIESRPMFKLIPKDTVFFDLFELAADNVHNGALAFAELLEKFDDLASRVSKVKEIEHKGDQLTHETMQRVNSTFITPIDREDIHQLVTRLDDVIDLVDAAATRIHLYRVERATKEMIGLGRVLVNSTESVVHAVRCLRNLKRQDDMLRQCVKIHTHENEGDRILQNALAGLFNDNHSPIEVIKLKDIYEDIELATDRCEDVANVLESIVLKNA